MLEFCDSNILVLLHYWYYCRVTS